MSLTQTPAHGSIALIPVTATNWQSTSDALPAMAQQWAQLNGFTAKAGQICVVPNQAGGIHCVLAAYDVSEGYEWSLAGLPEKLPAGNYHLQTDWTGEQRTAAAIGWGLGCYRFDTFKSAPDKALPHLFADADQVRVDAFVQAISLVRDLINAPANHMMPEDLSAAAQRLASTYGASFREVVGEALLTENYPAIHAVGRASSHAPRLLELQWGNPQHPHIAVVGKGVCFDTGGLDLKPSQYMRLMQKDMGGAAHALGLAQLIMATGLPVHLHVLIAAVENAVGGDAFRPGDILSTRAGKSVEVDNTDAEGRLVLCDAFTAAVEQQPELLLDFATLTGAARVALGTEIPVFFCNDKPLTCALQAASEAANELIWNLPLHKPYFAQLKSQFADFQNSGGSYGGAITAALFLNEFVPENLPWAHFDMMAWNTRARAGRPIGGEAMGLLAVYRYFETNYRS